MISATTQIFRANTRRPRSPLFGFSTNSISRQSISLSWPTSLPTMPTPKLSLETITALQQYTACDIADALLKLKVPNAGFLADLELFAAPMVGPNHDLVIAPASTVVMASKTNGTCSGYHGESNVPAGKHWVDLTEPETIVVMTQPEGQKCAVLGGIMALRMKVLSAKGVVVSGRVRDVEELSSTGLPIWAKATSIVGSGAESKPHALQVPLDIGGTIVKPGDIVFSDTTNGVVVIPQDKLEEVMAMLPRLIEADERVKENVSKGMTVQQAFEKHRS